MRRNEDRILSLEEAAKIIYATAIPDLRQVGKIREKLHNGQLRRSPKGDWTTTALAVADYLARHAVRHGGATAATHAKELRSRARIDPSQGNLSGTYQHLLRDYFLAMVLRRTARKRSKVFDRSVLAGQAALILLSIWLPIAAVRNSLPTIFPERTAVQSWLDENAEHGYSVEQWFPPAPHDEPGSVVVRVRYKYLTSRRKSILTDRQFLIQDGVVRSVSQTE